MCCHRLQLQTLLYVGLLAAALPQIAQAQPNSAVSLFEAGNEFYAQGEYARARSAYEQALETGYVSGMLFYNLGNVYYRLDELGHAIRYYEKARRLLPDDARVQHNLEIANTRTVDQFPQVPEPYWRTWWQRLVSVTGARALFFAGLAFYLAVAVLLAYRMLTSTRNPWHRRALAGSMALGIVLLGLAYLASADGAYHRKAVVIAEAVALRPEPAPGASPDLNIHEGVVVDVLANENGWVEVRLPNGATGWIDAKALAEI